MQSIMVHLATLGMRLADRRESGQGLAEYGLILFFIAILCIVALGTVKDKITILISSVGTSL